MALRCLTRALLRNVDNSGALRQSMLTSAFKVDLLNDVSSLSQPLTAGSQTVFGAIGQNPPKRYFSHNRMLYNAEDTLVSTESDITVIDPSSSSSSSAASLIISQVEEVMTNLPLTERLFAVVQLNGNQFRVSQDDVLTVEDWLPAETGERIRLEKVLLLGGREFSLIGRPLLRRSQVSVEATVIEKTLTATDVIRRFRPRSRFKKTWYTRKPITYLRINSVKLLRQD